MDVKARDRMLLGMAAEFLLEDMRREMRRGGVALRDLAQHRQAMADLEDAKRRLGFFSGSA